MLGIKREMQNHEGGKRPNRGHGQTDQRIQNQRECLSTLTTKPKLPLLLFDDYRLN